MAEYIERKQTIDRFEDIKEKADSLKDKAYLDAVMAVLENIPSADVAPVVHARWYWDEDGYCRCSRCHQKCPDYEHEEAIEPRMTYHCPYCGAKMDLESA